MAIGALLLVPLVFVSALLSVVGPAARSVVAGDLPDGRGAAALVRRLVAEGVSISDGPSRLPLAGSESRDAPAALSDAPELFEPRNGTFGLHVDEHDDHADGADDGSTSTAAFAAEDADAGPGAALAPRQAVAPVPTPWPAGPPRSSADLPILMYHRTGPLPPNPDAIRRDLTVSPALFEAQLAYLATNGIESVTLDRLDEHLEGRQPLPARAVVLTFDDGYADNYDVAFPLLKKYGMVGTFFVTTGLLGRPDYMTWDQLEEMADAGMTIGAHSISHADFTKIASGQLTRELAMPKQEIEERLGRICRFLAYPSGKFDPTVVRATKAAGYTAAVTVQHGTRHTAAGPFELTRVRVRGGETAEQLGAKLTPPSWRGAVR